MKNYSRAYNRHKKHTKFINRAKKWFSSCEEKRICMEEALSGKSFTFLRTTGRPCNCYICTLGKYKRTIKHKNRIEE